jgi:putative transposase
LAESGKQARREAVGILMAERQMGVTRACGLVGISRSLFAYRPRRQVPEGLRERIGEIATTKRRYGYRRIHVLLRREGWTINHKRTHRLYREAGLQVRKRARKRILHGERSPLVAARRPNESWSMDFVSDALASGRRIRCLTLVDDFTKECLATVPDTSITGLRVARELDRVIAQRCAPISITVDNGPEFAGRVLDEWAYRNGIRLRFIRPGKPVENAYVESFNGKFRDECLNEHWFASLAEARVMIEAWRREYNFERPHSSIGNATPAEFAEAWRLAAGAQITSNQPADSGSNAY